MAKQLSLQLLTRRKKSKRLFQNRQWHDALLLLKSRGRWFTEFLLFVYFTDRPERSFLSRWGEGLKFWIKKVQILLVSIIWALVFPEICKISESLPGGIPRFPRAPNFRIFKKVYLDSLFEREEFRTLNRSRRLTVQKLHGTTI